MEIVKQGVARAIPCLLIQSADGQTPETGALAASVTISYRKEGATAWSSKTATGNWTEITPGKGAYLISWSTTDLNTVGRFDFVVEHASCINYYGSLVVSANLLDDLDTTIDALNDLDAAAVLAALTTDSTKWAGANLNATISSRSSHAAADVVALMNDLNAAEILAAITTDSTKFAGTLIANLDAAITTRSSHAAADVIALMNDLSAAEILAAITTDSVKFAGADIASIVSAIAALNDPTVAAIVAGVWTELQAGYTTPGTFGYFLDLQVSAAGGGAAPTVAQIAEAVHDIKVTFNKTTGGLVITMADDTPLTSVVVTDTSAEVTRE